MTSLPDVHLDPPPSRSARRILKLAWLAILIATLGFTPFACDPAPRGTSQARQESFDREWAWLREAKKSLDAKRAHLEAGDAAKNGALKSQVAHETGELQRRLIGFLNAQPPVEGEPLSPRQKAAIRMKSDEDILLGRTFISQGGDFQRAIELYETALGLDPGYDRLKSELEEARARRYLSRETFDELREGMTEEEVRQLLGQPNLNNVKDYTQHGVVGWFYPKDETGAAAGVWFEKDEGTRKVYKLDFDAIRPRDPAPEGPPVT